MKIAAWYTGHPICDTVAQSLARGFHADLKHCSDLSGDTINAYDCHIAYGILRGTANVFKSAQSLGKPWFHFDKGYFGAEHYTGTYRISFRGTQLKWHDGIPRAERCPALKPWRSGEHALICPPTPDVAKFFDIDESAWLGNALRQAGPDYIIRHKTSQQSLDLSKAKAVITFNSSVGWLALQDGIPCLSDPLHSAAGSYCGIPVDRWLLNTQHIYREPFFEAMQAHQFTLAQIEQGQAWGLIKSYLTNP